MKLLKIGKILTVILSDGTQLINTNVSDELFSDIKDCIATEDELCVKHKMAPELYKKEQEFIIKKELYSNISLLVDSGLFEVKNDAVYRVGINISLPEMLINEFLNIAVENTEYLNHNPNFEKLDNFWMWCSLNPNPESREDLFRFLIKHQMSITNDGMVLAYRRVVSKNSDKKELVNFVSNQYIKVKTIWKKNPEFYNVLEEDGKFVLVVGQVSSSSIVNHGNLKDLYLNLPNLSEQQFTDNHTNTFDYRIGQEVRMSRSEGNQSNQVSCSKGFHCASKEYDYSGFGDTPILLAFNPMDVLSVPVGEDGKIRVCAFTPIAVLEESEDRVLLDSDIDISELTTFHYQQQIENLRELISNNTPYELKINNILSDITSQSLEVIIDRLDMNIITKDRMVDCNMQLDIDFEDYYGDEDYDEEDDEYGGCR